MTDEERREFTGTGCACTVPVEVWEETVYSQFPAADVRYPVGRSVSYRCSRCGAKLRREEE